MHHRHSEHPDFQAYRDLALQSLSRFGALPEKETFSLFQALNDIETWPQGREVVAEGAVVDRPRLLLEGWALRQRNLADGRRQIFGFLLPGDVFGLCVHPEGIAMCSVVAATPLVSSPLPFLNEAMRGDPGALREFVWRMIAREEENLRDQVVRLGRQSAHERMIHLLLEFYAHLKEVAMVHGQGFHLPLSQEILSDALGLSLVHTNRTLQQLKREHLIETHGGNMVLPDPNRMAELANYRPASFRPQSHQAKPNQADAQASMKVPSCSSTQTFTSMPSA